MAEKSPEQAAAGCLGRFLTIVGFVLFALSIANEVRGFDGDGFGFELNGGIIPGLALMFIGRAIRRRAPQAESQGRIQIPVKPPPPQNRPVPKIPTKAPPPKTSPPPPPPPVVEIPELPVVEEVHRPGELPAVQDLEISDFELGELDSGKPMSSEERLARAKERYRKKPQ